MILKKLKTLILEQLKTGISHEKLADAVLAGLLIGVFPILGVTTILAFIVAYLFKLNQIVIQGTHYLLSPLQLIAIPLYIKFVSVIFKINDVPIRPDLIMNKFKEGPIDFFKLYGLVVLYSVIVWMIISFLTFIFFRPVVLKSIKKMGLKK